MFSGPVETLRQTASLTNLEIMKICEYCELTAPGYRFIHMYKPAVSQVFYDCVINKNINFHANPFAVESGLNNGKMLLYAKRLLNNRNLKFQDAVFHYLPLIR